MRRNSKDQYSFVKIVILCKYKYKTLIFKIFFTCNKFLDKIKLENIQLDDYFKKTTIIK